MDAYYELAGAIVTAGGGRVVKFIGDATLTVFPPEAVDHGVADCSSSRRPPIS